MAEISAAVASTIIERVVDAIVFCARYLLHFNNFVVDFRKSKRGLEKALQHMKECAKEATTNAEKIVQPVEEWLNDVERVLEDAQKLEERVEESQCCLNVTFKYSLAKEVICMTQQMNLLNNNKKFEPFSHPIELSSMNYFFPKDFVALDSRKPVYEELLKAIQDERSNVIGVVGEGGSGKSTLARVVGKQVEESKLFDRVVMTIVSQDVKVRDIQGQIADHLTFSLMEETELGRALRLSYRLKTEKILIILDGVWERLDLEAVGIPLHENGKRCCILLTTRNQEVCTSMNCQSMIELSMLNEDEGWTLFKQRAQIDDDSPEDLREVAKRVFDKCQGLLVAILTAASTLKGKNCTSWELALSRLETSESIDVQEVLTSTCECNELEEIICLDSKEAGQLRYLYAPSQPVFPKLRKILIKGCSKLRKIFFPIMVSSLPELRDLSVHDCNELVEIISSEEARKIPNLSFPSQQVSFPKLGGIEIKRCNKLKTIFFATIVSSLPELNELSVCDCNNLEDIISSDSDEARQHRNVTAPHQQFFPKLWSISIENCNKLKTFFSATTVTRLPELQQLVVKDCNKWEEIIFLDSDQAGQLRNLYPLHNQDCFPKLRSVQIERCNTLNTIFITTIVTSLPELVELIVKDCNEWLEIISLDLEQARQVGNLSAHSKQICFPKLQRIEIESCKRLKTIFSTTIVTSLPELQQLVVKNCNEWEGIISLDSEEVRQLRNLSASPQEVCFPKLGKIEMEKCNKLKAIFSSTIVTSLPELEKLIVKDCNELEEIISLDSDAAGQLKNLSVPSQQVCFPKLGSVSIERCSKFKRMFSAVIVKILPMLKQLVVKDCNEWEEIISLDSEEASELGNVSAPSHPNCFPRLRKIEIEGCNRLKAIFSSTIVTRLPMLEQLFVKDCSEWEEIISLDSKEARQLRNQSAPFQQVCFPELRKINIESCNKLKAIFSTTIVTRLPNLVHLIVKDCNEWEEIISLDSGEVGQPRNLYASPQQICFPLLRSIMIERCSKLKKIFPATIVTSLPELVEVIIQDCNEWEEIIYSDSEEAKQQRNLSAPSQQVFFPKLETIYIEKCNKLKRVFCITVVKSLPMLRWLDVKDCNEWEEIISLGSREAGQHENFLSPSQNIHLNKLQNISIERCNKLKTIFSVNIASRLPNLKSLFVDDCNNLEAIISPYSMEAARHRNLSAPQQVSFPRLGSILISRCSKLKNIFFAVILSSLPELKSLYVLDCNELEDIISSEAKPLRNLSTSSQQLYFPTLQSINIERCNKLKTIFSLTIVRSLPKLGSLSVNDCNELEEIFSLDSEEAGQVAMISAPPQQVCLPKIHSIRIKICNKLKCIFPYYVACHCSSLDLLDIESCSQLEQIVKFEHKATSEEEGAGVAVDDNHIIFGPFDSRKMAEIGTAVASTIIEHVVDAIIGRARYLFCFQKSVIDLRKSKRELEKALQRMKERAKEATTNAEKIVQPVEEWLNDVERVLEDAQRLEERVEESQCCLNVTFKYSLVKEVICMTQQMNLLNNNSKFEPFSHPIELSSMNYFFPKDFVALDSRKPVYEELVKAIQDERSNVIGVVGEGGSGKSTLARVVGKQVEESKLFDKVVMTIVSQDVKVRDIQGQIADHLTFSLVEETELGRALRLFHRLKTEKILIILDGVWERLDLEAVGIPLHENGKRCCILLTTRNQEVCTLMNCQSTIELSMLNEDEGWTLFKQRAQIDDDSPEDLREVAKRVFDKCQGLLVAILTVASTLKGKTCTSWELALSRLETSESIDVQEVLTSTCECNELEEIICLDSKEAGQLRYLYAPSQPVFPKLRKTLIKGCNKLRKIFFPSMVSSLPELRVLSVHDCNELVEIISSEEARQFPNLSFPSQQVSFPKLGVIEIKRCNKLKTIFFATIVSSLPELNELIVCDCNNLEDIMSSDSDEAQQHRNVTAPHQQFFPKLWSISIENCNKLKTFFSATTVTCLPELQQLVVKDCNKWEEIFFLDSDQAGQLRNQYPLYNQDCLPKLRRVQIERCNTLKTIFITAIVTSLPELVELIVKDCNEWVEIISLDLEQARQVGNVSAHSKQIFPKLQRIEIESCKRLKTIFSTAIVTSLPELQQLVVKNCNEWEGIISLDSEEARQLRNLSASPQEVYFPKLKMIEIKKCNKLKAIFSTTIVTCLPELEQLIVQDCNELEETISLDSDKAGQLENLSVPSQQVCFPKLGCIRIERCCKFKRMFSATIVKILPELEQLVVKDCNEWVEIISSDSADAGQLRNLRAHYQQVCFRRLRKIEIERCNKLKAIFSANLVTRLPRLEILIVKDCNEWEEIISLDCDKVGELGNLSSLPQQVCFPMLFEIIIERCNKLKRIFPATIVTSLPELVRVAVTDCNEWEDIISLDSEEARQLQTTSASSQQICIPKLEIISIEKCNKLKTVFCTTLATSLTGLQHLDVKNCNEVEFIISLPSKEAGKLGSLSASSQQVCFPKLRSFCIIGCNKMKTIFFATIVASLSSLNSLFVADCDNLEAIVSPYSTEEKQHRYLSAPPHQVFFPELGSIVIVGCEKLKTIFFKTTVSSLPELKTLCVSDCNKLEDMISSDSNEVEPLRNLSTPPQQVYFPKLEGIAIQKCNKLKKIFSLTIVGSLPELKSLNVNDCNELEEVFSLDSEEAAQVENLSALSQQVCLPKLSSIWIGVCNKMKFIFSYSMACHCPSLHLLSVESCSQLEQIVEFEHKATSEEGGGGMVINDDQGKHLLFPDLVCLYLKKLPTLTGIFPWFEFQYGPVFQLGILTIEDCPKYLMSSVSTKSASLRLRHRSK
ncbi:putative disease resistance protein [Spatholobus suberectus]|nr:putative disease resistance protein [Spatholobus suberectus]